MVYPSSQRLTCISKYKRACVWGRSPPDTNFPAGASKQCWPHSEAKSGSNRQNRIWFVLRTGCAGRAHNWPPGQHCGRCTGLKHGCAGGCLSGVGLWGGNRCCCRQVGRWPIGRRNGGGQGIRKDLLQSWGVQHWQFSGGSWLTKPSIGRSPSPTPKQNRSDNHQYKC